MTSYLNKSFFIIFSLILVNSIFLLPLVNSVSISEIQTATLTSERGTAFLGFNPSGTALYAVDNWHGAYPNWIGKYSLSQALNLSTLSLYTHTNLTDFFPVQYKNYSVSSAWLTRDTSHLYLVISNKSGDNNDATSHKINYSILHFNVTNGDLTTITFNDYKTIGELYGASYVSPSIYGMFVSDNGLYAILSGRYYNSGDIPFFIQYEMTNPFIISNASSGTNPFPYGLELSYPSYASYANFWGSSDYMTAAFIDRDIRQSQYKITLFNKLISNGSIGQTLYSGTGASASREGLTLFNDYLGNNYLFSQGSGTLYKYSLLNLTTTTESTTTEDTRLTDSVVNPIINLFPDYTTLTLKQRIGYTLIVMLLTAIIILFASSQMGNGFGFDKFVLWIIAFLLVIEFIFFAYIQYIPVGITIVVILALIALSYLRIKGGN